MLTSILPGLRDLRTPLATGYMWLAAAFLVFADWITNADSGSVIVAQVSAWGGALGTTALLSVLTFVAYVVGSALCVENTDIEPRYAGLRKLPFGDRWAASAGPSTETLFHYNVLLQDTFEDCVKRNGGQRALGQIPMSLSLFTQEGQSIEYVTDMMKKRVSAERRIIANRMRVDGSPLWDDWDRESAEGQFRLSIVLPLTVILLAVFVRVVVAVDWWGIPIAIAALLGALTLVMVIYWRGIARLATALEIIYLVICMEPDRSPFLRGMRDLQPAQGSGSN